jgi:hypothetical protein
MPPAGVISWTPVLRQVGFIECLSLRTPWFGKTVIRLPPLRALIRIFIPQARCYLFVGFILVIVGLMQAFRKTLDHLCLISWLQRPISFQSHILIGPFIFTLVNVLGLKYFLIDPRVVDIIFLVLVLNILIVLLVSADLVGLAIFLWNLGIDLLEDDILFLKK